MREKDVQARRHHRRRRRHHHRLFSSLFLAFLSSSLLQDLSLELTHVFLNPLLLFLIELLGLGFFSISFYFNYFFLFFVAMLGFATPTMQYDNDA